MTASPPSRSTRDELIRALAIFLLVGVAFTWPVWRAGVRTHLLGGTGDPALNATVLAWNATHVPFSRAWWNPPYFYPTPGVTTFTENLLAESLIASPVYWITRSPAASYNVALALAWPLSGFAVYLLVRALTGRDDAAIVAGLIFGFSPYRTHEMGHLQMASSYWIPIVLFALHAYLRDGRPRWLLVFAAAWILQSLANLYMLLFGAVLVAAWLMYFCTTCRAWRQGLTLLGVWAAATVPLVPLLLRYGQVHAGNGLVRELSVQSMSLPLVSWMEASHHLRVWGPVLHDHENLFPGITAPLLVLAAMTAAVFQLRSSMPTGREGGVRAVWPFYAIGVVLFALSAMGPTVRIGTLVVERGPYWWLMHLPGFNELRSPVRLWMLGVLCLSVLAGLAYAALPIRAWRKRWAWAGLIGVLVCVESWADLPVPHTPYAWAEVEPVGRNEPIIELPLGPEFDAAATYRSALHGRPVVNGVSGYDPRHYELLQEGLANHDPRVLVALADPRGLDVVISTRGDPKGQWQDVVSAVGGVSLVAMDGQRVLYRLPANGDMARALGVAIPVRAVLTSTGDGGALIDANPRTVWEDGPRQAGQWIELDLGQQRRIGGVALALGDRVRDYPRALRIDVSTDGASWRPVFDAPLAAWAVWNAAMTPLDATLRLTLPSSHGRFVRLEQTTMSDRPWVMAEVTVHEPAGADVQAVPAAR